MYDTQVTKANSCEDVPLTKAIFLASVSQTLLVDGYISQTFRSRTAEQYFLNLLKETTIPPHATLPYTEGYFFFVSSVPPHIPRVPNFPGRWLLDRGIVKRGTVVPQTMWTPRSVIDRRQHIEMGELQMPIFFEDKDGVLGVSLRALIDDQCHVLRDANIPAPLGEKATTLLRIVVSTSLTEHECIHHQH